MKPSIVLSAAAVAGLLWSAAPAYAAPMKCSDEHKACVAGCAKLANRNDIPVCVTNCHARNSICMHSGCWNNGVNRYCNYLRK
ncbi:MAG TPA: hypothetical protein VHD14_03170 [Pseudolabrys sp.]|jgi:hypothetical protein|nr:hypothetical protein [Pseudolabrys sp.]